MCEIPWQLGLTHLRDVFPECPQRHITAWGYAIRAWMWGHKASWAQCMAVLGSGSKTWSILTYLCLGGLHRIFFQSNMYVGPACAWPLVSWYRPPLTSDDISLSNFLTAASLTEQTFGCLANRGAKKVKKERKSGCFRTTAFWRAWDFHCFFWSAKAAK